MSLIRQPSAVARTGRGERAADHRGGSPAQPPGHAFMVPAVTPGPSETGEQRPRRVGPSAVCRSSARSRSRGDIDVRDRHTCPGSGGSGTRRRRWPAGQAVQPRPGTRPRLEGSVRPGLIPNPRQINLIDDKQRRSDVGRRPNRRCGGLDDPDAQVGCLPRQSRGHATPADSRRRLFQSGCRRCLATRPASRR